MVEPIGHTGGIIDPPDEYLPQLREICDRHNALLIFDEIVTGIGRTGNMFAAETFGVTPDLICLGKGISGGYAPLSALICRRHIADAFWGDATKNPGFVEGHTFEGNPISCAAGLATIDEILQRALPANARAMGEKLRAGLENMKHRNLIGDIRGKGLFLGIEFVRNTATKERFDPPIGIDIGKRALANGLLTRFDPHWIALGPPLTIDEQCVNAIVTLLGHSIGEVLDDRNWQARARTEYYARATAPEFAESECASDIEGQVAGLCDGLGEGRMDKLGNVQIAKKREFRGGTLRRAAHFTSSGGLDGSTASRICQLSSAVRLLSKCPLPASAW